MTKIYYGPDGDTTDTYRLVPAPTITIDKEFLYSNDVIIGYTYTVNLNGYITNYRKLTDEVSENNPDYYKKSIEIILGNMEIVRKILSRNSSSLMVKDDNDDVVINCKGGTLRSLTFDETPNSWTTYATYSASIEFNEIEFLGSSIACSSADFDSASKTSTLVDIDNHKIKSFTDGWSFTISEQSFDFARTIDTGKDIKIHNMTINASYNINVTGKNYYIDGELSPAHEQARIFAQKTLYNKVVQLVSGSTSNLFKITTNVNSAPCGTDTLNTIHQNGAGILGNITYVPHNETISCEISESDGSFSASYSCILKSKAQGMTYSSGSVIHTVNRSRTREAQSQTKDNYTISVDGNIQGLVPGGLIYSAGNFSLPQSGSFLVLGSDSSNKYSSAASFYGTIGNESDLNENFKDILAITFSELNIQPSGCDSSPLPLTPKPTSFNLTRNMIEGTISYNAEYSTSNACARDGESIQNISISVENPTPILAEFIIPKQGIIIQDIKTVTSKKVNITIDGRKKKNRDCCLNLSNILDIGCEEITLPTGVSLPDPDKYILTQKNRTDNRIEGTFNITLNYICASGCNI